MEKMDYASDILELIISIVFMIIGVAAFFLDGMALGEMIVSESSVELWLFIGMMLMGMVYTGIAMFLFNIWNGNRKWAKKVYFNGRRLYAVIVGVVPNPSMRSKSRPALSYVCDAIDEYTHKWHRFRGSEDTFYAPPLKKSSIIDIYIDGDNAEDYWLDMHSIRPCTDEYTDEQLSKFFGSLTEDIVRLSDQRLEAYKRYGS